jgi:hypothetical protein
MALMTWLVPQLAFAYEVDPKRGTVVLTSIDDFARCVRDVDADFCMDGLTAYVKAHPNDAFAAAKAVRVRFNHYLALRFFVATPKLAPAQCADPDLGLAVVAGLGLPSDDANSALALKLASGPCWNELQERVRKQLTDGSSSYTSHVCGLLKQKNLTAEECEPVAHTPPTAPASPLSARLASVPRLIADPESAQSFRGEDNEQVLWVRAKAPHDSIVLLKFKGVRGAWNGTVVRAIEQRDGDDRDYIANVDGRDWIVMTRHDGAYAAYPKGYDDALHLVRERLSDHPKRLASTDVMKEFAPATQK